jgi:hypothetical protein
VASVGAGVRFIIADGDDVTLENVRGALDHGESVLGLNAVVV